MENEKVKTYILLAALVSFVFTSQTQILGGQEIPGASVATVEHEFLQKFVGEWELESDGSGVQGKATMKSSMLGKLWLVNSSEHDISGTKMKSIQMIGYDPEKKKYVGIWADSMINHMWNYEGVVDESGKRLVLDAMGPSMAGDGKMSNYRDSYEFKDNDTIISVASVQGADGKWSEIMKGKAKRIKNDGEKATDDNAKSDLPE
jgi:hypothetical protein